MKKKLLKSCSGNLRIKSDVMNYLSKQFAEEQAENDLRAFCHQMGYSRFVLPVDPAHVAEILWETDTIFLEENTLEGESVIAFADLSKNRIVVEMCGYEPRERFSIAHEVGHISMHRYLVALDERRMKDEKFHEYQADTYASALLMPKNGVLQVLERETGMLDTDADKVSIVSAQFHVSKIAAKIRLETLNLISNPNMGRLVTAYDRNTQASREEWFKDQ